MNRDDVLAEFAACGALLRGHFVLSSGLHSDTYLNKSLVSMHPDRTERLCRALAAKAKKAFAGDIRFVVSPAMGAIIYGYETARHLGVPFMFVERVDGAFALRRGFTLNEGDRVLIVEDIVSTGLSSRECIDAVRALGAEVVGLACLIDRSGGKAEVGAPMVALAEMSVEAWPADALPEHLKRLPPVKPGSRGVSQ
ncbi:MAG: orotate phosphoribosyltransferase [Parvularculaceae bacterium]|jgi:orotate phosphoribosyltransferase|nr:orotate phosphoribosyltransferase [Parvularculaceae bacterium]